MGTRPIVYKYPLDLTGNNPNNLVLGEPHTLPAGDNRAVVPNYGAFFADSLRVREVETGRVLIPRQDFKAVQLYQEATQQTGLEVCAALVVTNNDISSNIEVDYQAIGGEFSYSVIGLRKMLEDLNLDDRPVRWGDMIGRPSEFPPAPHLHDAGDLYGFEYLVEAIDALRHAIMTGQEAALGELRQYIELVEDDTRGQITQFFNNTTAKLNEYGNRIDAVEERTSRASLRTFFAEWMDEEYLRTHSYDTQAHRVTKYDVGLGHLKDNNPMLVTQASGELLPILNNKLVEWAKEKEYVLTNDDKRALDWLSIHRNDLNHHHQVKAGDLGLNNITNQPLLSITEAVYATE